MQTDPEEDYARGWVPFLDCKIYLDSRPLIPRLETEYWVEKATEELRARFRERKTARILDLFAGSGAIGVAVLKHLPRSRVDFGEIDASHFLTVEKNIFENCSTSDVEHRHRMIETDVWSNVDGVYDAVLANPPYLSRKREERVQRSVLLHEPDEALFAEENGFALIRKTVEGASARMASDGVLYIEHEPEHVEKLATLAAECGFSAVSRKDQFGALRYSVLRRGAPD